VDVNPVEEDGAPCRRDVQWLCQGIETMDRVISNWLRSNITDTSNIPFVILDLLAGTSTCTEEGSIDSDFVSGGCLEQYGRQHGSSVLAVAFCSFRTRVEELCSM